MKKISNLKKICNTTVNLENFPHFLDRIKDEVLEINLNHPEEWIEFMKTYDLLNKFLILKYEVEMFEESFKEYEYTDSNILIYFPKKMSIPRINIEDFLIQFFEVNHNSFPYLALYGFFSIESNYDLMQLFWAKQLIKSL